MRPSTHERRRRTDPVVVDKDSGVFLIPKIWFSTRPGQWGQRSAESATPDVHKGLNKSAVHLSSLGLKKSITSFITY